MWAGRRGLRPILSAGLCALLAGCSGNPSTPPAQPPGGAAGAAAAPPTGPLAAATGPADEVDPFIGTGPAQPTAGGSFGSGDVFPGAAAPSPMLAWSPDTTSPNPGGYSYPDDTITGFSLTHFSGRGCRYHQDVPIMAVPGEPTASPLADPAAFAARFSHRDESARPGSYQVRLGTGTSVALAATTRTGIGEFTFPAAGGSLVVEAGSGAQGRQDGALAIDPAGREAAGSTVGRVGCGSEHYTLYFALRFDRPLTGYGTWAADGVLRPGVTSTAGAGAGGYLAFGAGVAAPVRLAVGISYVSVAGARANLAVEDPGGDPAAVRAGTTAAWNAVLGRIRVTGGSPTQRRVFYTAAYHSFFHPSVFSDADGKYIGFDDRIHQLPAGHVQYAEIPGWDQYRSLVALQAILAPAQTSDVVASMLRDAEQGGGGLPRWEQANRNSGGMVGDSPDAYIATAYAFGATGFDTDAALAAMIRGASSPDTRSGGHLVRENLAAWLGLGYVPGQPSVSLEYATDDFALAQFAQARHEPSVAQRYLGSAERWKRSFDPAIGYVEPRDANGGFRPTASPGSWGGGFVEGNAAQYTWMVPFDRAGLAAHLGGRDRARARLGAFFTALNAGPGSPRLWIGNEPSLSTPYTSAFLADPATTEAVVRRIELEQFTDSPGGLPGNDDGGAMSSWYVLSALGLFPAIPGVAGLVTASPLFPDAVVTLGSGATIHLTAPAASPANPYVRELSVGGRAYQGPWIDWSALASGTQVAFTLAGAPTGWGSTGNVDAPPSWDHS